MTRAELEKILSVLYDRTGAKEYFDEPTVGVASANDPFFAEYKKLIGEFHWTPQEALSKKFPDAKAASVISWVLPIKEEARKSNRKETDRPSVIWACVRSFGELVNEEIRRQIADILTEAGYPSVAPHLLMEEEGVGLRIGNEFTSKWSERHAAFVAGLGTFGLSASLITRHGCAMRLGSVVTALELPPDERPYGDDPFAWCTKCGACAKRCPANAVGPDFSDRDKDACAMHVGTFSKNRLRDYGWLKLSLGCGLCQTAVPCEHKRP